MRKLILFPAIFLIVSCNTQPVEVSDTRIEITPFIVSKSVLKDTNRVRTVYKKLIDIDSARVPMFCYENLISEPAKYLDNVQFNQLAIALQLLMNDPKSKVYLSVESKPLDRTAVKNIFFKCDSIIESTFDSKGVETITKSFACDSTSIFMDICRIDFYETWYFNKATNMIEKDVIGYSVLKFVEKRNAFRHMFMVFRDEKGIEKAKKYYSFF